MAYPAKVKIVEVGPRDGHKRHHAAGCYGRPGFKAKFVRV